MTKYLLTPVLTALVMSLTAGAQENNPLLVSGHLIEQAGNLYDSGQYKKAIALYQQIDRNDTNYVRSLSAISSCLFADSQFSAALEYAKKGLSVGTDPEKEPDFYNQIGNNLNEQDASEQAIRIYDSAIRKYPYYSLLYLNKGTALIRLKRFAEAEAIFKQVLVMDPYSYSSHYKLGYCALNQGKLVPAILSFTGYLMLSPDGRFRANCIGWLNKIAKNVDTIQTFLSQRKEDPDENYQLLEQILQSKIALDKNYKTITQLDDAISRQIQVVFEKMQYQAADNDFWMQYYIPWFKQVYTDGRFELFINRIFSSVNIPVIQEYVKKHKKELSALTDNVVDYLDLLRSTQELNYTKRNPDTITWSYSHGSFNGHGLYFKKTDKLYGPWTFFYPPGTTKGSGAYNAEGGKEGNFIWYHPNGRIKGKEYYHNGKQEGEETYYFSNGQPSSHSWYKNNQLEGESIAYYWTGGRHTITHYLAGKEDGVKIIFHNNGDTSVIENYIAGNLDGEYRSWTKYKTPDLITAYKKDVLDGHYQKFYENGQLHIAGDYKAGKQEGEWKTWYANGQLKSVTHYVNDKTEGDEKEYFENGAVDNTCSYKNGKLNGDLRYFDEDTKPYAVLHYSNGTLQKAQYFDKTGKMVGESNHDGKAINLTQFLPDGSKRSEIPYNDKGDLHGTETFYYQSGQIEETDAYENGIQQGPSISYYPNGNKKTKNSYANGKLDGYHQSWYSHGQIQEEGWYKENDGQGYWLYHNELGDITDSNYYADDFLDGYKVHYAPNGKKTYEDRYHSGWLEEEIQYDSTGKVLSDSRFPAGTGHLRQFYSNGKPSLEAEYRRAQLVGPYKEWYFDGKPMEVAHYNNGMLDSSFTTWFYNGSINTQGQYYYGEKTGVWKYYTNDGHPVLTEEYVRGELTGPQTRFYPNGKPEVITQYRNGKKEGTVKTYDPDGTLLFQLTYLHGDPVSYTYLDKRDSLLPEIPIPLQTAKIKTLFPNGKVSAEFALKDGYTHGEYRLYYTNGQLRSVNHRNYGELEGEYNFYYPSGQLKESGTYLHDNLHGVNREYNEKGIVTTEWNYYNGDTNGITKLFDDTGHLRQTDLYYYGTLLSVKK